MSKMNIEIAIDAIPMSSDIRSIAVSWLFISHFIVWQIVDFCFRFRCL